MGKLGRFLRLERARPAAGDESGQEPTSPGRFAKLEPRSEQPAEAAVDPFAPPPEREIRLEVESAPNVAVDRAKAEKRARAEAELEQTRDRVIEVQNAREEVPPDLVTRAFDPLVRMTNAGRWYVLGGSIVVIAVLAQIVGAIAWGLLPIVIAVLLASLFTREG